jgi:hypothetical protein
MRSLAQTQMRTRCSRRTHAGSGPNPPPNEVALPNLLSIPVRIPYNVGPNSDLPQSRRIRSMQRNRRGL